MTQIYNEYSKARVGWFLFGLTGKQLAILAAAVMPVFWAVQRQAWASTAIFLLVAFAVTVVTVMPVRGRSAVAWATASLAFAIGGVSGWLRFRSRASRG